MPTKRVASYFLIEAHRNIRMVRKTRKRGSFRIVKLQFRLNRAFIVVNRDDFIPLPSHFFVSYLSISHCSDQTVRANSYFVFSFFPRGFVGRIITQVLASWLFLDRFSSFTPISWRALTTILFRILTSNWSPWRNSYRIATGRAAIYLTWNSITSMTAVSPVTMVLALGKYTSTALLTRLGTHVSRIWKGHWKCDLMLIFRVEVGIVHTSPIRSVPSCGYVTKVLIATP